MWAFINFNTELKSPAEIRHAVADGFIDSHSPNSTTSTSMISKTLNKLFHPEMAAFDRGPAKLLKNSDPQQYNHQRYFRMKDLIENKEKIVKAIARQYTGEKRFSLVVVFDNVDKRSRDVQLAIFEAAQWFKELTRALVIVNLRDTTFEAHRDEPPLDAFINAVNFYIKSPRFAAMLRKRLDIVLENIQQDPELSQVPEVHARIRRDRHLRIGPARRIPYEHLRFALRQAGGEHRCGSRISCRTQRTQRPRHVR